MKKLYAWLCLVAVAVLGACSTDVDLYADYKDVPIVYAVLDATADTNFVKITRAMYAPGDAYQAAANPDSSNYPGKLDVRLVEYRNGDSIREIILDTITIHNKEQGVFYAPDQKLYFTTEPLNQDSEEVSYTYRLKAVLPGQLLTTEAKIVGNGDFIVQGSAVNFSKQYIGLRMPFRFRPAVNATIYDVSMTFTFLEQRTPDDDSVPRSFSWRVGSFKEGFYNFKPEGGTYEFRYAPYDFYETLEQFIGGDTCIAGLKRFISDYPVEVAITAGGENLRKYLFYNDMSSGFVEGSNEFTVIEGGYGVFSSRMTVSRSVKLGGETVPDLVAERKWGFKFIGGEPLE